MKLDKIAFTAILRDKRQERLNVRTIFWNGSLAFCFFGTGNPRFSRGGGSIPQKMHLKQKPRITKDPWFVTIYFKFLPKTARQGKKYHKYKVLAQSSLPRMNQNLEYMLYVMPWFSTFWASSPGWWHIFELLSWLIKMSQNDKFLFLTQICLFYSNII